MTYDDTLNRTCQNPVSIAKCTYVHVCISHGSDIKIPIVVRCTIKNKYVSGSNEQNHAAVDEHHDNGNSAECDAEEISADEGIICN